MSATNAWDEAKPAGGDLASTLDDATRQLKLDVRERLAVQHVWNTSQAADGKHRNITVEAAYNAANTEVLKAAGGSRTGSNAQSEFEFASTWNTSGSPAGYLANVTKTAAGALAALFKGIVDAATVFYVALDGVIYAVGLSISGVSDFQAQEVRRPKLTNYSEKVQTPGSISGAVALDWSLGNHYSCTLSGNVTFSFSNIPGSYQAVAMVLQLTQDGTGGRTVTWPAAVRWPGAVAPTLSGANKSDFISLYTINGGATIYGFASGQNFA